MARLTGMSLTVATVAFTAAFGPVLAHNRSLAANGFNDIEFDIDDDTNPWLHAKKLISIDEKGQLWLNQTLENVVKRAGEYGHNAPEPVNVIAFFGRFASGKSTLATMLSCKMADIPIHFPANAEEDDERTFGIWISQPFRYNGKTFILMDLEGLRHRQQSKEREQAVVKVLAMLSEIASMFIQTVKSHGKDSMEMIGHAFRTTREHLITASEGSKTQVPPVQTQNHASFVIAEIKPFQSSSFGNEDDEAQQLFEDISDVEYKKILSANFEGTGRVADVEGKALQIPFRLLHLPKLLQTVDAEGNLDKRYDWLDRQPFQTGEGCEYFRDMETDKWKETAAATYAQKIEQLAQAVSEKSVERRTAWGNSRGVALVGSTLWDALTYGLDEMNKIGPLPDDEMWRLIMGGGCEKKCIQLADQLLGHDTGALKDIAGYVNLARTTEFDVKNTIKTKWETQYAKATKEIEDLQKATFAAVVDTCKKHTNKHLEALEKDKDRLIVNAELHTTQGQLKKVQQDLANKKWEEDKLMITCGLIAAAIIALVGMRMFRQVNMTCRECLACFGPCFVTTHSKKVGAAQNQQGIAMHAMTEQQRGIFAPPHHAGAYNPQPPPAGGMSDDASDRINRLERMILTLTDEKLSKDRMRTAGTNQSLSDSRSSQP